MGSLMKTIIAIFLLLVLQSEPATPQSLLEDICNHTKNPKFCLTTFQSDPRTSSAKDVLSLAKIGLELAMKDSAKTQRYIHVLSTSKRTEPIFKPALNECVEEYKRVAASFRSAYLEVKDGEYETANYDTLTAADYAGNCEKVLANAKAHIQSVSDGIQVTKYFSSIGDRVTTILWTSQPPASNP
ncbi:hypothetical protein P3X46_028410 [Hevea brasiliensis]|uniref:Pectinesterase inhibitor domain-containing protein n=1 Tax=Hevea brasiliensis TaxID=3981 RepID=A0ABQ9KRW0_HEVBR|nr:cell wall / vacuolar inhibitor of fructosidase 2-like [Hevea brasiliensis]KAJ9146100.1 hypothetical protein P3X46_028410 [Hevea brasiliensis]